VDRAPLIIVDEHELAFEALISRNFSCDRTGGIEVKPAIAVVTLRAGHVEIVAQPEIDSQPTGKLPVILEIESVVLRCRSRWRINVIAPAASPADQHRCDGIPLHRTALVRVFIRYGAVEAEVALRVSWLEIIQPHQTRLCPEL